MIVLVPNPDLTVDDIKYLRDLSGESIAVIKQASQNQKRLRSYPFFENNWQELKVELEDLIKHWENREAPFALMDVEEDFQEELSIEDLKDRLQGAYDIEGQH